MELLIDRCWITIQTIIPVSQLPSWVLRRAGAVLPHSEHRRWAPGHRGSSASPCPAPGDSRRLSAGGETSPELDGHGESLELLSPAPGWAPHPALPVPGAVLRGWHSPSPRSCCSPALAAPGKGFPCSSPPSVPGYGPWVPQLSLPHFSGLPSPLPALKKAVSPLPWGTGSSEGSHRSPGEGAGSG